MKRAFYRVRIAGLDISSKLTPLLTAIEITDNEGQNSDTARITIDDAAGTIKFPRTGERIDIDLGWVGEDASAVFSGVVDEVRSSGSRGGGRELMISAKGMDAQGRAKEPQQRSFEGARDLRDVMERAGRDADVTEIIIAPELASVTRSWWGMNDESFLSFGERIAREVGGVFKIRNGQALLVPKIGGTAGGGAIPTLRAAWGENLISWEVSPLMGRARHGRARARWYDRQTARWQEQTAEVTADPAARATTTNRYPRADQGDAEATSGSDAGEVARQRGEGSVTIDGNAAARAGGPVSLVGARPGIDGEYRCKSVEHSYSRQGWTTKIDLQLPQGGAGNDGRRTRPTPRTPPPAQYAQTYDQITEGATDNGPIEQPAPPPYFVRLLVPDLTLVDDIDDTGQAGLREYALLGAYKADDFRATVVSRSADQVTWSDVGTVAQPVTWGNVLDNPPIPATPGGWDDTNTISVRLNFGKIGSASALDVLNGANRAALISTDGAAEIIQFRDATALGNNLYRLSGLLRGRRGTEDLIGTRSAGDAFVLLDSRFQFLAAAGDARAAINYRAVTSANGVETTAATVTKISRGRGEKPYPPCHVNGARDGANNLSIAWVRRTRIGGEWLDGTGTVPLGETSEAYEVDILSGPPSANKVYASSVGAASSGFDGLATTYWTVNFFALPQNLDVTFSAPQVVRGYGVRAPTPFLATAKFSAWDFQGWDGSSWVTLDSRIGQIWSAGGATKTYALDTPAEYAAYRFYGKDGTGGSAVSLSGLAIYRHMGGPDIAAAAYAQTVSRTIGGLSSPAAAYSAADQTADFGAAQPEIFARIYQISGLVGRGVAAEVIL